MTQCTIHDHSSFERYVSIMDRDNLYGCSAIMNDTDNTIIQACMANGWLEEDDTWGSLTIDDLSMVLSNAFVFRDTFDKDSDEYEQMFKLINTILRIMCANLYTCTGLTIDNLMIVRGKDEQISVHFTLCDMYSFRPKPNNETSKFLSLVVDNSDEINN